MRFGTLLLPLLPALLEQLANSLPAAAPCNCPPRPAMKGPALISPPNPHVWVNPEQAVFCRLGSPGGCADGCVRRAASLQRECTESYCGSSEHSGTHAYVPMTKFGHGQVSVRRLSGVCQVCQASVRQMTPADFGSHSPHEL